MSVYDFDKKVLVSSPESLFPVDLLVLFPELESDVKHIANCFVSENVDGFIDHLMKIKDCVLNEFLNKFDMIHKASSYLENKEHIISYNKNHCWEDKVRNFEDMYRNLRFVNSFIAVKIQLLSRINK